MNNLHFGIFILVFSSVVLSCNPEFEKSNIVVILADDLGYGDLSSYGHPIIETVNLDRLASLGIRFMNFYSTAPICSPSRVGLLTGRSPNRAGVYDFIPGSRRQEDCRDLVHRQKHEITIPADNYKVKMEEVGSRCDLH